MHGKTIALSGLSLLLTAAAGLMLSPLGEPVRQMWHNRNCTAEEVLYQGLWEQEDTIYLAPYQLTPEETTALWNEMVWNHPELFYVSRNYEYLSKGQAVLSISPQYEMTGNELLKARADYTLALRSLTADVNDDWTEAETALYLHDVIVTRYSYDEFLQNFDVWHMLTQGRGVCQAYALTYEALLQEVGIECRYVLSPEMEHSWNLVRIDGEWYHADLTFDDPTADRLGRARHDSFLVSDTLIASDHTGWQTAVPCTSTLYDQAVWRDADSGFVSIDGTLYAIADRQLCRWDQGSLTPLLPISDLWYTDSGNTYWDGCFSVLASDGQILYYNTPDEIRSYDPKTETVETVCSYTGAGDLYGFLLDTDGSFLCQVSENPNSAGIFARLIP